MLPVLIGNVTELDFDLRFEVDEGSGPLQLVRSALAGCNEPFTLIPGPDMIATDRLGGPSGSALIVF